MSICADNAAFWDELCGTQQAKSLGVVDSSPASLRKFDDWYFDFYPYLYEYIPFDTMRGKDVLECGLGYGTVSQKIAESGAQYHGLDIADGPVAMVNQRLKQTGLPGTAIQGSILSAPFEDNSFDYVVAIGCLHHTGDLQKAISECFRILRPGGKLIFMVYYAYSYRRFYRARLQTLAYFFRETMGKRAVVGNSNDSDRAFYDSNTPGDIAPHTDWISKRSLAFLCKDFSFFSCKTENIDNDKPFHKSAPRAELLKTKYPSWFGLDLYAIAEK